MSGVSGIGGGGPGRIPTHGNDDKDSKSGNIGDHDIVYDSESGNRSRSSSSSSEGSIEERTRLLLGQGFQVRSPEEVGAQGVSSSVSKKGASQPGFLSRMWTAVKGVFSKNRGEQNQGSIKISSPIIPGHKQVGVRLPESRMMQSHFQQQTLDDDSLLDVGDTDVESPEHTHRLEETSTTSAPSTSRTLKEKLSPRNILSRVRGWWIYTNKKQETPVEGKVGLTLAELTEMVETYNNMIEGADTSEERALFTEYRDAYQQHINDLNRLADSKKSASTFYLLDDEDFSNPVSDFNAVGEAAFLDIDEDITSTSDSELIDIAGMGDNADNFLGEISPEVARVLKEAHRLRLEFDSEASANVEPTLRSRIQQALDKLREGVVNILTIIKNSLIALARSVRRGLQALGELVRRRCHFNGKGYELLNNEEEFASEVVGFIQKHTNAENPYPEGTLTIPETIVDAWVNGQPEIVYVTEVGGEFGRETVRYRGDNSEGVYEVIGSKWSPHEEIYEEMRSVIPRDLGSLDDHIQQDASTSNQDTYLTMRYDTGKTIYDQLRSSRIKKEEDNAYDVPSFRGWNPYDTPTSPPIQQGSSEGIYNTPRPQPIYDSPRGFIIRGKAGEEHVYDIPRFAPSLFRNSAGNDEDGYLVPDNQSIPEIGVTVGFANAVDASYYSSSIGDFLDGVRNSSAGRGASERTYPMAGRALPEIPSETPPPSPYGENRMMGLLRRLQDKVLGKNRGRSK
ncbi:hypothetical protein [Chlamydia felis Fe/C-56]|uniref:Uncharacterized protein n=1 Tax=Chlamydia felis (strain Fe/C-56) TaxID=264202 RepID=Q253M8_CHLFF|nr:hypothetical protein [Chlamydia felis]BAE81510.1 hypothetical protein [Chlamydia felis Fe/C-56]